MNTWVNFVWGILVSTVFMVLSSAMVRFNKRVHPYNISHFGLIKLKCRTKLLEIFSHYSSTTISEEIYYIILRLNHEINRIFVWKWFNDRCTICFWDRDKMVLVSYFCLSCSRRIFRTAICLVLQQFVSFYLHLHDIVYTKAYRHQTRNTGCPQNVRLIIAQQAQET